MDEGTDSDSEAVINFRETARALPKPDPSEARSQAEAPARAAVEVFRAQRGQARGVFGIGFLGTENPDSARRVQRRKPNLRRSVPHRLHAKKPRASANARKWGAAPSRFRTAARAARANRRAATSANRSWSRRSSSSRPGSKAADRRRATRTTASPAPRSRTAPGRSRRFFDRVLSVSYPIYTSGVGNCEMTRLGFLMDNANIPTTVDLGGVHMKVVGTRIRRPSRATASFPTWISARFT